MYALFAICNALSPSRLDDNILNIVKDRYGDQFARLSRGYVLSLSLSLTVFGAHVSFWAPRYSDEGLPAFEELFLYACPKFISANPPPYDDQEQLAAYAEDPSPEPAQRHLALFLSDVRAQAAVPTLRSFLKLYTSLDAAKLAGFLDADEEEMVQQMMAVKAASRSVSRVGHERNLLDGQMISTSDMDFVINEVSYRCPIVHLEFLCPFPDFWGISEKPEHGSHLRGHGRSPLRGLVHTECGARAACVGRRQERAFTYSTPNRGVGGGE